MEDQADIRENLALFLKTRGYRVIQAADGESGFTQAIQQPLSLVITDLSMPGWDGRRLCEELARHPATAALPVVVLTAWCDESDMPGKANCRIAGYITKPFRLAEVTRVLDEILANKPAYACPDDESGTNSAA